MTGVRCWEVILKRLSHLGFNVFSAIHEMSTIWDARYLEVSLYLWRFAKTNTNRLKIQDAESDYILKTYNWLGASIYKESKLGAGAIILSNILSATQITKNVCPEKLSFSKCSFLPPCLLYNSIACKFFFRILDNTLKMLQRPKGPSPDLLLVISKSWAY